MERDNYILTEIPDGEPVKLISFYEQFAEYYPKCEPATKKWFVENVKTSWTIIDCGANIGYFSILFSRLAKDGVVHAFEPTSTFEMLLTNLEHCGVANVVSHKKAIGRVSGRVSEGIFRIWGQTPEHAAYDFVTIDDFVDQSSIAPDFIKIDLDSYDLDALIGAEKTLLKYNPFVMVELNHALSKRNQANTQALEWMLSLGYNSTTVFDYDNFLFKRDGSAASKSMAINFAAPVRL